MTDETPRLQRRGNRPPPPQEVKPTPPSLAYLDSAALAARLSAAEQAGRKAGLHVALTEYGRSAADRPLLALWVGALAANPQVLVHGGLGANDAAGTVACLDLAERLAAGEGAEALRRVTFVLIPAPNPDALDAFLRGAPRAGGGALDRDKDGARGEDGPDDLDGDGEVRLMRRRSPRGTWALASEVGREATPERDPPAARTQPRSAHRLLRCSTRAATTMATAGSARSPASTSRVSWRASGITRDRGAGTAVSLARLPRRGR
jgi:hypothetical protein